MESGGKYPVGIEGGWLAGAASACGPGWDDGCGLGAEACSGCAGDYEDPDRTAGEEFAEMLAEVEAEEADE